MLYKHRLTHKLAAGMATDVPMINLEAVKTRSTVSVLPHLKVPWEGDEDHEETWKVLRYFKAKMVDHKRRRVQGNCVRLFSVQWTIFFFLEKA